MIKWRKKTTIQDSKELSIIPEALQPDAIDEGKLIPLKDNALVGRLIDSIPAIGKIIDALPMPKKRKYTLNFAVTSESNLDVDLMNKYFDKKKCIVKITPIHKTVEAEDNGYEIVTDFDVYEKFEQPLVRDGWDVIVFIPSKEEDEDRITCGNSLIALNSNEMKDK